MDTLPDHCVMQDRNFKQEETETAAMYDGDDEKDVDLENGFVFNIDRNLLIEPRHVFVRRLIGEGSYSKVYEGLFESKPVAVKIIQPMKASDVIPEHKKKFQREVTMQSRMNHENVVKLIGASVEPVMFLVTELVGCDTLQKYLWSVRPSRLDLKLSISFALDISQAMEYMHANGIIHRDLRPSNLFLTEDKKRIKVGGFGLAREEIMDDMTCEAGTYRWMAPEIFSKEALQTGMKKHYDHKVDVYSFAIVFWQLLTNEIPFKGRDNITVGYATAANKERPCLENLPKDIALLLQSCWAEDPCLRPDFTEITKFLKKIFQEHWPVETRPSKVMEIGDSNSNSREEFQELLPTETKPSKIIEIEDSKSNRGEEFMGTDHVRGKSDVQAKKKKHKKRSSFCFPFCFSGGLSD